MESSLAVAWRACAGLEDAQLIHSSIATDLDFAVALHSFVGFVPFAITVQTVNVENRTQVSREKEIVRVLHCM